MTVRDPESLVICIMLLVTMAPVALVSWLTGAGFSGGDGSWSGDRLMSA